MNRLILIFCFVSTALFAQQTGPVKPFIEITGTAETEIVPDEIYVTITLSEQNEGKDKRTIEMQEDVLKKQVKELGIDVANLSLNSADARFRNKTFRKDMLIKKSYLLKVPNAEMIGQVYERLDKMDAHDAYISRFTHSKILDFQKENRIKAVKAARDKADYLLGAVGKQVGDPIEIIEIDSFVQENPGRGGRGMHKAALNSYSNERFLDDEPEQISFKKIKLRASFHVKYEIK